MTHREQDELLLSYALLGATEAMSSVTGTCPTPEQEEARRSLALCEALVEEYHRMLQNEDDETISIGRGHLRSALGEALEKVHAILCDRRIS